MRNDDAFQNGKSDGRDQALARRDRHYEKTEIGPVLGTDATTKFLEEAATRDTATIDDVLAELRDSAKIAKEHFKCLGDQTRQIRIDQELVTQLQKQVQSLGEQFHEREVLRPILMQLIALADRCRQKELQLQLFLAKNVSPSCARSANLVRHLLEARQADRVEIEGVLANLGVEPFEHTNEAFDRSLQTCVSRVPALNPSHVGHVADRLRPGYRRNGQVIRSECVAVYVVSPEKAPSPEVAHARN